MRGAPDDFSVHSADAVAHWRSVLRGSVSGLTSVVVHMALILTLGLVTCNSRGGGDTGGEVLLGELPELVLTQSAEEQFDAAQVETPSQAEEFDDPLAMVAPPAATDAGELLAAELVELTPSGGAAGGSSQFDAVGGGGGSLGGGASFMGVYAHGSRFCIIADCSGSMVGPKLEYVKQEILETLSGLGREARFQIVFFHSRETPYPQPGWRNPRRDRADVERWLATVEAGGGTHPTPAFRVAFELSPSPDAIFFMTDGQFPPQVVDEVAMLNGAASRRVKINTISFIDQSAKGQMQKIADDSGGVYRHVAGF